MADQHIHTPGDGRGVREVFIDGKRLNYCFYADTRKGIARCYRKPIKIHKRKREIIAKTFRGKVIVNNG